MFGAELRHPAGELGEVAEEPAVGTEGEPPAVLAGSVEMAGNRSATGRSSLRSASWASLQGDESGRSRLAM